MNIVVISRSISQAGFQIETSLLDHVEKIRVRMLILLGSSKPAPQAKRYFFATLGQCSPIYKVGTRTYLHHRLVRIE